MLFIGLWHACKSMACSYRLQIVFTPEAYFLALLALIRPLSQTALAIGQIMPDYMCVCPCNTIDT